MQQVQQADVVARLQQFGQQRGTDVTGPADDQYILDLFLFRAVQAAFRS